MGGWVDKVDKTDRSMMMMMMPVCYMLHTDIRSASTTVVNPHANPGPDPYPNPSPDPDPDPNPNPTPGAVQSYKIMPSSLGI